MLTRNLPRDWRGWHWAVEILVAALILLFVLYRWAGGQIVSGPDRTASSGEVTGKVESVAPPIVTDAMVARLWQVLELQATGRVEEAIDEWIAMDLPRSVELYRYLGLAQAYLATGQLEEARDVLTAAGRLEVSHPLIHYFRGVYLLARSDASAEWPDRIGWPRVMPAAETQGRGSPLEVVPNTASMYRRAARSELRSALTTAADVCDEASLFPSHAMSGMWVEPTYGDFVRAIRADRYAGNCHQLLGQLDREQGNYASAEQHLDAARTAGVPHFAGYEALARDLESDGYFTDAARVYLKALGAGEGVSQPARRALRSVREAWMQ